jgi:NitT/TauT family transport system substrate-binding protein
MRAKIIALALAAVIVFSMTACQKKTPEVKIPVRLSEVIHSVFYAPQYIALHKGFFEKAGLEVTMNNAWGADKGAAALLGGTADVGLFGPEQAVYSGQQGAKDPIVAFAQCTQKDGSFLVGRKPEPNFKWSELKGTTIIGGRKGGVPEMNLEYQLRHSGVEPFKDVEIIQNIQLSATAAAFAQGTGDYVQVWEPSPTILEREGQGYVVAPLADSGLVPYTVFHALKSTIDKNPEMIQRFTDAIYEAQKWVYNNDAKTVAEVLAPEFPDITMEDLIKVVQRYKDLEIWAHTPVFTESNYNRLVTIMKEAGELTADVPYKQVVTTEFADKSVK